jgi:5-methyltetrahydropteroyltriglutamate--homocysteine methyltransferase
LLRSTDRIMSTHAGSLPRSNVLRDLVFARTDGSPYDERVLTATLRDETAAVVARQVQCGLDSVNDGELGKRNFQYYVRERLRGFRAAPLRGSIPKPLSVAEREKIDFAEYFSQGGGGTAGQDRNQVFCVEPLEYVGRDRLEEDIANLKAAASAVTVAEAYVSANSPGTIEHWLRNDYYRGDEAFLFAIADCMRVEYQAIVDAGFTLQIDDPDLPDGWQMYPHMTVAEYRKYAQLRVEALNHGLRGIPREKIRLHVCWGSFHGPHHSDIPLRDIIDVIFNVNARTFSIEASNPCHEHEWAVFKDVKLPDGAVLVPGVVGHCTDFIEHPQLVAQRLVRYAKLVGRENVVAGTDCGLGHRVADAIAWAKLRALADGARLASRELF